MYLIRWGKNKGKIGYKSIIFANNLNKIRFYSFLVEKSGNFAIYEVLS